MESSDLEAGEFSAWVDAMLAVRRDGTDADVPCATCTACCRSGYFVHIEPDEVRTLGRVPRELLFPAPGLPRGHVVLGHDEHGRCPMLTDEGCSIYDDRPRTCRAFDCRVFPAAGLAAADDGKPLIDEQARRWRFAYASPAAEDRHRAVRSAARYLQEHPECFPGGAAPANVTQLAMAALLAHAAFLAEPDPDAETVRVELRRSPGRR